MTAPARGSPSPSSRRLWCAIRPRHLALLVLVLLAMMAMTAAAPAAPTSKDPAQLLRMGNDATAHGDYDSAIRHYSECISSATAGGGAGGGGVAESALYKRAEVRYLRRSYAASLQDYDLYLQRTHSQSGTDTGSSTRRQAARSKARIHGMLAQFDEAQRAAQQAESMAPGKAADTEMQKLAAQAREAGRLVQEARRHAKDVSDGKGGTSSAEKCVQLLGQVLYDMATGQESAELRLTRAECALAMRQFTTVNQEIKRVLGKEKKHSGAMLLYSTSLYRLGAVDQALNHVRNCLKNDPDNGACRALFKQMRQSEKVLQAAQVQFQANNMKGAVEQYERYLNTVTDPYNLYDVYDRICEGYTKLKDFEKGISWCTKLIDRATESASTSADGSQEMSSEHVVDALANRAECHILDDNLDAAQRDAKQAQKHGQSQRISELLHRIDRLRRMAARKNYYKILGVERSATKHEIKKAYRKLAMKYHPDRMHSSSEEEKTKAESKLREVTEAYEILSDDDKRRRYDSGEDMEQDQRQQHHHGGFHGGHPFHQFFQRGGGGGGGGFEFRFG